VVGFVLYRMAAGGDREDSKVEGTMRKADRHMRIVFLTNETFATGETFRYIFAHVAASFPDTHFVAVRPPRAEKNPLALRSIYQKVQKVLWRAQRFGVLHTLEHLTSWPLQRLITRRNWQEVYETLRALPRPPIEPQPEKAVYVETLNGPDAVKAISRQQPDVVIPISAGILRRQVFGIARIGTLNLHRGILPLIRGLDPIYWALWKRKPEWMGVTVHYIDEGIDTGPALAYAPVEARYPGERFPSLFVRATEIGVECLVDVLCHLARGERWTIRPPQGESVYHSHFSGWRLVLLETRLALRRFAARSRKGINQQRAKARGK
jgi:methionyl-tRNA formyltransferase